MPRLLPLLGLGAAALAAALLLRPAPAPAPEGLAQLEKKLGALSHELRDLRDEQVVLDDDLAALADVVEPAPAPAPAPLPLPQRLAGYAARLAAEEPDPRWSGEAEVQLSRNLQPEGQEVQLVEASCGATLCRVELQLGHPDAVTWALEGAPQAVGWDNVAFTSIEGHGPARAVLYVAREGYELDG